MSGYSTRNVADIVGMTPDQVRHFVRRKLLSPVKGANGKHRFDFKDLVLLRTAKSMIDADVSPRSLFRAMTRLKASFASPDALSAVRLLAQGDGVVVRAKDRLWNAETGQGCLDFAQRVSGDSVTVLWEGRDIAPGEADELSASEWCQLGVDLEEWNVGKAMEAYQKAVLADPNCADAWVNLGRLHQLRGNLKEAKRHYELAVEAMPGHQLANYNLGTVFDELNEGELAARFYAKAPDVPDAHFNLARISRRKGDELAYRRHQQRYMNLTGQPEGER